MRIKFLQRVVDKVSGKSAAVKFRNKQQEELYRSLAQLREKELAKISAEFDTAIQNLSTANIQNTIDGLEASKSKIKRITAALIKALTDDLDDIFKILDNPDDQFSYANIINYEPLHLLIGLTAFHKKDYKAFILKLLRYNVVDYQSESYGVIPVKELLNMDEEMRAAMRERMMLDIKMAIDQASFDKALRLIGLDRAYFKEAKLPNTDNETIISYSSKFIGENEREIEDKAKFINFLIRNYKFEDSAYTGWVEENIREASELVESKNIHEIYPHRLSNRFGMALIYKGYQSDALIQSSYNSALVTERAGKAIHALRTEPHGMNKKETDLLGHYLSDVSTHFNIDISNQTISSNMAKFLAEYILPWVQDFTFLSDCENEITQQILYSGLRNSKNLERLSFSTFNKAMLNDNQVIGILESIKSLPKLWHVCFTRANITDITISYIISQLKVSEAFPVLSYFGCDHKIKIPGDKFLEIFKLIYLRNPQYLSLTSVNVNDALLEQLSVFLKNDDKILYIHLIDLQLGSESLPILKDILLNCKKVRQIVVSNSNLSQELKDLIAKINESVQPSVVKRQTENQDEYQARMLIEREKELGNRLSVWKSQQLFCLKSAFESRHKASKLRKDSRDIIDLKLTSLEVKQFIRLIEENVPKVALTVEKLLLNIKQVLQDEIKNKSLQFFDRYLEDLKNNGVNNWGGCIHDLHVIARIMECSIHLNCESFTTANKTKIYGSEFANKIIHIIRKDNVFYGFNEKTQVLIPNVGDNLNLFRACVHARLCKEDSVTLSRILNIGDELVLELRQITAHCLQYSRNLCEIDMLSSLNTLMSASTEDDLYLAALDLPLFNIRIMSQVFAYKKMLGTIPILESVFKSYKIKLEDEISIQKVSAIIYGISNVLHEFLAPIKLGVGKDDVDLKNVDIDDLQTIFEERSKLETTQTEDIIADCKTNIQDVEKARAALEAMKKEAIQELVAYLNEQQAVGIAQIHEGYRQMRRHAKKALVKAGLTGFASFLGIGLFGEALKTFFAGNIGLGASNAKLLSDATLTTVSQQAINGGKLKRLPEHVSKSFVASKVAATVTSAAFKGATVNKLPTNPNQANVVKVTHKAVESMGKAAFGHRNVLREGITTAASAGLVNIVAGDAFDTKFVKVVGDAATRGLYATFNGANSDTIAQEIGLGLAESLGATVAEQLLPTPKAEPVNKKKRVVHLEEEDATPSAKKKISKQNDREDMLDEVIDDLSADEIDTEELDNLLKKKEKVQVKKPFYDEDFLSRNPGYEFYKPNRSFETEEVETKSASSQASDAGDNAKTKTFSERFGKASTSSTAARSEQPTGKYSMKYGNDGNAFWPEGEVDPVRASVDKFMSSSPNIYFNKPQASSGPSLTELLLAADGKVSGDISFAEKAINFVLPVAGAKEPVKLYEVKPSNKTNWGESAARKYLQTDPRIKGGMVNQRDLYGRDNPHLLNDPYSLDEALINTVLISSGRVMTRSYQGAKQLGLGVGEKFGIFPDGATSSYTALINSEKEIYHNTPVARSITGKTTEVVTEIGLMWALPGGAGLRGAGLVYGSAISGAAIRGLEATYDGSLSSRGVNVLLGAAEGATVGLIGLGGSKALTYYMNSRRVGRSLGANPFQGSTFEQIGARLEQKGFNAKGSDPVNGQGSYFHPKSGRKYYFDNASGDMAIKGSQRETPHVDVHRKVNGRNIEKTHELPGDSELTTAKKKYSLGEDLYEPVNPKF